MVWRRRHRPTAVHHPVARGADRGLRMDGLRVPDRDDLAQRVPGIADTEMDDQGDLSDRQDRPRYAAFHALPRSGAGGHPIFSAQVGDTHVEMAEPAGAVRSAFAAAVLLRRIPVLWRALDPGSARPERRARALDGTAR